MRKRLSQKSIIIGMLLTFEKPLSVSTTPEKFTRHAVNRQVLLEPLRSSASLVVFLVATILMNCNFLSGWHFGNYFFTKL